MPSEAVADASGAAQTGAGRGTLAYEHLATVLENASKGGAHGRVPFFCVAFCRQLRQAVWPASKCNSSCNSSQNKTHTQTKTRFRAWPAPSRTGGLIRTP